MKIYCTQKDTCFKSQFTPSPVLQRTFDIARRAKDTTYINALNGILSNGKKQILDFEPDMIRKGVYRGMIMNIDGECALGVESRFGITEGISRQMTLDVISLVKLFADMTKVLQHKPVKNIDESLRQIESNIFKQGEKHKV